MQELLATQCRALAEDILRLWIKDKMFESCMQFRATSFYTGKSKMKLLKQ
jgi:hypothetical protein